MHLDRIRPSIYFNFPGQNNEKCSSLTCANNEAGYYIWLSRSPPYKAYNSVSLVSLLACLSQLVYSLDVWPSAEKDTQPHMHTLAGDLSQTSLCGREEAEHSRSGGLHSAMNINYGKHPHSQRLCRHILPLIHSHPQTVRNCI